MASEKIEIERKFLLYSLPEDYQRSRAFDIKQSYFDNTTEDLRVRKITDTTKMETKAFICRKRTLHPNYNLQRIEEEHVISLDVFDLLTKYTSKTAISKTRHRLQYGKDIWEVDQFWGENSGLYIAEIEMIKTDYELTIPEEIQKVMISEVTDDKRYRNSYIAKNPGFWKKQKEK